MKELGISAKQTIYTATSLTSRKAFHLLKERAGETSPAIDDRNA